MQQLVVLLRGINLGSARRVAMADLRAMLDDLGYEDVRTVLQSGNAVLRSGKKPDSVARAVEKRIAKDFGLEVDAMVRTGDEIADVVSADPLAGVATDGAKSVVIFLSGKPPGSHRGQGTRRGGLRAGGVPGTRARAVRVVPGRPAEEPGREGAHRAAHAAVGQRDGAQLEHRPEAARAARRAALTAQASAVWSEPVSSATDVAGSQRPLPRRASAVPAATASGSRLVPRTWSRSSAPAAGSGSSPAVRRQSDSSTAVRPPGGTCASCSPATRSTRARSVSRGPKGEQVVDHRGAG